MDSSTASRPRLVVAHPERKAQRALQRLVAATGCPIELVGDADALLAASGADAIAIVDATLAHARPELRTRPARAWIVVPGEGLAPATAPVVADLLGAGWDHVIAHPMPLLAEELVATVQKLIRGDVFGLDKYLGWGADVREHALADARDRDRVVADLAREVVALGLPARFSSLVSVIADELIANALYAAPVDDRGVRFRAQDPRERARALAGRDAVVLRWASDGRYLALEVRDRWGSLDLGAVGKHLAAAAAPERGGAGVAPMVGQGGIGLQLAYACCNQLVVGCAAAAMTEVIALLDVRHKPTELARSASFHAFAAAAPPTAS